MKTLNHSTSHVIGQSTVLASAVPTQAARASLRSSIKHILIAGSLTAATALSAWAGPSTLGALAPDSGAVKQWRTYMEQNATAEEGCFHASYPSTVAEKVACTADHRTDIHPVHRKPSDTGPETVGNGDDYVAEATGLLTWAEGEFDTSDVKSVQSVGVPIFGDGGILGNNEYSVQLNTNMMGTTSACKGHSGCTVWQQFVYATDYVGAGKAGVFMQYWLINYDASCPSGWSTFYPDCFKNSLIEQAPDFSVTELGDMQLAASAAPGGKDKVEFYNGNDYWWVTEPDSILDISSVWNEVEFNILGDAGGSEAVFNKGASISPFIFLQDGSESAPRCIANDGTTGETNNLNLDGCWTYSWILPYMVFTESN
jgi:hypothetical protein